MEGVELDPRSVNNFMGGLAAITLIVALLVGYCWSEYMQYLKVRGRK